MVCCNVFVKDVAIIYDNYINVQEIICEILTHMFVPAFSGTHGIALALMPGFQW